MTAAKGSYAASSWETIFRYRAPIDPDYPSAPTVVTLHRDNMDGLVLFVDEGDGAQVTGVPLPGTEALDLAAAINTWAAASGRSGEQS
jgi:hypothetical protein